MGLEKEIAEEGRGQEEKGGRRYLLQLEFLHLSLPQMGPNAKELFRLVEDFVDVIGFRMKDLRDAYQVTDNLGKQPPWPGPVPLGPVPALFFPSVRNR